MHPSLSKQENLKPFSWKIRGACIQCDHMTNNRSMESGFFSMKPSFKSVSD